MASTLGGRLTGLVAAAFTPLTAEGEINLPVIGQYIDYLLEHQGVRSVFVNGTTGEWMSLTVEERKRLAEEWCRVGKGRLDHVIVHVGSMSLKDSQDLARHAAEVQADGISAVSPSVFKPADAGVLRQFLKEVAAAAPNLPFYYYHIPALTGVKLLARDVLDGVEKEIPSFRGVKFTDNDLVDLGQCISYCPPDWSVLYGVDEHLLAGAVMGVHGAVGSTFNYLGSKMSLLLSAFEEGNIGEARTMQFQVQDFISYARKFGWDIGVNKQLMCEISGLDLGPPRLPLRPCPHRHASSIARRLLDSPPTAPQPDGEIHASATR
ncbi:hypothetical protein GJAV_G00089130 [Gymnothorax javanicus]|nr:hypothetical protein GJAV_G00089130 [Gymnothorax javanicus]